jgi:hypothetical protein
MEDNCLTHFGNRKVAEASFDNLPNEIVSGLRALPRKGHGSYGDSNLNLRRIAWDLGVYKVKQYRGKISIRGLEPVISGIGIVSIT